MIMMKQKDVLEILEKHANTLLRDELDEVDKFINNLKCKICNSPMLKINTPTPQFINNLPKYWAKCSACNVEIEPYTGIQITLPNYEAFL